MTKKTYSITKNGQHESKVTLLLLEDKLPKRNPLLEKSIAHTPKNLVLGQVVDIQNGDGKILGSAVVWKSQEYDRFQFYLVRRENSLQFKDFKLSLLRAWSWRVKLLFNLRWPLRVKTLRLFHGESDGLWGFTWDSYQVKEGAFFHFINSRTQLFETWLLDVIQTVDFWESFFRFPDELPQGSYHDFLLAVDNGVKRFSLDLKPQKEPKLILDCEDNPAYQHSPQKRSDFSPEIHTFSQVQLRLSLPFDISHSSPMSIAFDRKAFQKTGLFLDQIDNLSKLRSILEHLWNFDSTRAQSLRILDLFCYVGLWGVWASLILKNLNYKPHLHFVDASESSLIAARFNAQTYGFSSETLCFDLLKKGNLESSTFKNFVGTKPYDIIFCDPPALAKASKDRDRALPVYARLFASLQEIIHRDTPRLLVFSSCSASVEERELEDIILRYSEFQILDRGFQSLDHPVGRNSTTPPYLKTFFLV